MRRGDPLGPLPRRRLIPVLDREQQARDLLVHLFTPVVTTPSERSSFAGFRESAVRS